MRRHPTEELINDYVDELLTGSDRLEVQRHLDDCDDCRATMDEIRSLVRRAADLPDLPPARDLLPGIRQATRQPGRRFPYWGAIAASLLVLGSAAIGTLLIQQRTGRTVAHAPIPQAALSSEEEAMAELRAAEETFAEAAQALLKTLESRREEIPEEALVALEENIALIDASIAEVRRSVGPGDPVQSGRALTALYQQKMQLLWQASRLSS